MTKATLPALGRTFKAIGARTFDVFLCDGTAVLRWQLFEGRNDRGVKPCQHLAPKLLILATHSLWALHQHTRLLHGRNGHCLSDHMSRQYGEVMEQGMQQLYLGKPLRLNTPTSIQPKPKVQPQSNSRPQISHLSITTHTTHAQASVTTDHWLVTAQHHPPSSGP